MPQFAANISNGGWLYNELPFLDRIPAAAKAGFTAVEAAQAASYDAKSVSKLLKDNNLCLSSFNTYTLPDYTNKDHPTRKFHGIYPDEKDLFKKVIRQAIDYAFAVDCPNVHILSGVLDKDITMETATATYVDNLVTAITMLEEIKKEKNIPADTKVIQFFIEAINDKKGRGIENYYLTTPFIAFNVIDKVYSKLGKNYKNFDVFPLKFELDFYHLQAMCGDMLTFMKNNDYNKYIGAIQVSQVPLRNEPCNDCKVIQGELNYEYLFSFLDNYWNYYVGLEYKPYLLKILDKNDKDYCNATNLGLLLADKWFARWNKTNRVKQRYNDCATNWNFNNKDEKEEKSDDTKNNDKTTDKEKGKGNAGGKDVWV